MGPPIGNCQTYLLSCLASHVPFPYPMFSQPGLYFPNLKRWQLKYMSLRKNREVKVRRLSSTSAQPGRIKQTFCEQLQSLNLTPVVTCRFRSGLVTTHNKLADNRAGASRLCWLQSWAVVRTAEAWSWSAASCQPASPTGKQSPLVARIGTAARKFLLTILVLKNTFWTALSVVALNWERQGCWEKKSSNNFFYW